MGRRRRWPQTQVNNRGRSPSRGSAITGGSRNLHLQRVPIDANPGGPEAAESGIKWGWGGQPGPNGCLPLAVQKWWRVVCFWFLGVFRGHKCWWRFLDLLMGNLRKMAREPVVSHAFPQTLGNPGTVLHFQSRECQPLMRSGTPRYRPRCPFVLSP